MALQSLSYLVCLSALWLVACVIRNPRHRQLLLLVASYLFYATWGLGFLSLLVASSLVNYGWGLVLRRRLTAGCLWTGILLNLLVLAVFKYLPPLVHAAPQGSALQRDLAWLVMPVGVSFWTFQGLSYLFDVYREEEIDPSLAEFCLYMVFWPTVLAGPVCRMPEMLRQFHQAGAADWDDVSIGTRRIVLGLFMKLVLAQLLGNGFGPGLGVTYGFDEIAAGWGGTDVWFLAVGFGFQLFFDFAGYSHIAIGSARLFGIRLAENFDRPYLSATPSVFWTRWHMSLSFWIRDYVFLPLATMRREIWWRNLTLVTAMALFGLWHAAAVSFILWGVYHGVLLVAHRQIQAARRRLKPALPARLDNALCWAATFVSISLGWILFRAQTLKQALVMIAAVFKPASYFHLTMRPDFYVVTALLVGGYFACTAIEPITARLRENRATDRALRLLSPLYHAACLVLIIVWSKQETIFVYFRF